LPQPARRLAETRLTSPIGQLLKTDPADPAMIFKGRARDAFASCPSICWRGPPHDELRALGLELGVIGPTRIGRRGATDRNWWRGPDASGRRRGRDPHSGRPEWRASKKAAAPLLDWVGRHAKRGYGRGKRMGSILEACRRNYESCLRDRNRSRVAYATQVMARRHKPCRTACRGSRRGGEGSRP
jgi:hypothetical protein